MTSKELRQKFLNFFEKNGHKVVPSSSLVPNDPSVLFTTAGMQQFKSYYLGEKSPYGLNVATSQKSFRTSDIEEIGDERHLTFFELLGNFSFGGYQKEKAIKLAKKFLDSINIKIDYVTVFGGDKEVARDEESIKIWEGLGFSEKKGNLKFCDRTDNFWGPTGEEGPCGPTTEIYSQGIEIWNIVFNQYYYHKDKSLTKLETFGVDTGMGLERLARVSQNVPTVFETDLFEPIIKEISNNSSKSYLKDQRAYRIIADHVKAAVFLISEGILPSNVERGYILRRILRRAIRYGKLIGLDTQFLMFLAQKVIEIYKEVYPEIKSKKEEILTVIQNEEEKFGKTLEQGLKQFEKMKPKQDISIGTTKMKLDGNELFDLYSTYGFPIELSLEEIEKMYKNFGEELPKDIKEIFLRQFHESLKKHQEISRAGVEKKFGGGGEFSPKLHTATHLLHAALRKVLGEHVKQMGSDITSQRLRFDFSHPYKMTKEELKKVEGLVNQKIKEDLEVKREEMTHEEALKTGALAFFKEKYPEKVTVYSIGDFSKEICAGPHVKRTSELGNFKIIKEESSGAGVRRIRGVLE